MKRCEMERVGQMKEYLEQKADFLISERIRKMESLYIDNVGNIKHDLEMALKKLVRDKGEGKLVISYLRSSYLLGNFDFYIAYYEGEIFVKEEPDCIFFNMQSGFSGINEDMQEMDKSLHSKFIRISQGEKEEIQKWYIEQVYKKFIYIVKAAVERIDGDKKIEVYYGGYMDEVELIYKI